MVNLLSRFTLLSLSLKKSEIFKGDVFKESILDLLFELLSALKLINKFLRFK